MKARSLLALLMLTALFPALSAEKDTRLFELRTYFAAPGKLDALHARFREHTTKLFAKHGMTNIGYWTPVENPEDQLVYLLAYPSREARDASWQAFAADPDWQAARQASEENGKLVAKVEQRFLTTTDFSPQVPGSLGSGEHAFELRTYTTTPGNLPALHTRFRERTMAFFQKYGMTNLWYGQLVPGQKEADNTLIYLLAHASTDAAKKSFAAFRADPEWVAVKRASEEKAGGSLTVPDGVKSVFMKATDYSPLR